MGTIDWLSDNLITMAGPVIAETGLPPSETPSGGVSAKLYDTSLDTSLDRHEETLTEDYDEATDVITVSDPLLFESDTTMEVLLDDGSLSDRTVLSKSGSDITMDAGLGGPASKGNSVTITRYPSGMTYVGLTNMDEWLIGMTIEITLANGTLEEFTVTSSDRDSGWVKLHTGTGSSAVAGGLVKRKIGADVSMSSYGTFPTADPEPGDETWGFRGTINHNHAGIQLGMRLRAEITYEDGTTNIHRKAIGTVINQ